MTRCRWIHFTPFLGAGLLLVACQNPSDKKKEEAQTTSDQYKSQAQEQAQDQADRAQQRANQDMGAAATALMSKEQRDYIERIGRSLASAQPHVDAMESATRHVTGAAKSTDSHLLQDVSSKREALNADMVAVQNANTSSWDDVKSKVEKDIDAYESSVKTAANKIKVPASPSPATNQQP